MNSSLKKIGLGTLLAATALGAAVPADAQRYGYGYRRDHDDAGAAIVAGIAGLAIGAAITSGGRRDLDYYYRERGYQPDYDSYYYQDHGYYPNDGYYAYNYRNNGYRDRCYIERRYDPYWDRTVRVRICR